MSSREAFEGGPGKELSLAKRDDGTYISVTTEITWGAWKAATERAAVCAWTAGMDAHKGNLEDHREIDSKCARAIREGNE